MEDIHKGCEFLLKPANQNNIFVAEEANEEQLMIKSMVRDFYLQDVKPQIQKIEKQEPGVADFFMEKMGELGILGAHMPEEYNGMDMDTITTTIICEELGATGSLAVSYNAHTGIGMLPLYFFGTKKQKEKYLPNLAMGKSKACYCLTEPNAGSDALNSRSTAILSEDKKHYILNGQKMWITNAGFADFFVVFAKLDGKFSSFIVEKGMKGLSLGEEENKLGIKGSSTRMVFLENLKIPIDNLLGEIGKGHKIALNTLNTGRFKLGVSTLGAMKELVTESIQYAIERQQFGQAIAEFGAVQHKLAQQTILTHALDAAVYRTAFLMNTSVQQGKAEGLPADQCKLNAAEEYALESSIIKIIGSEYLDYVADEAVQIHGGMGYSEEGVIARAYRDARINRIFEGTNEINRLTIISTLMRRAMKTRIDFMTPALAVQNDVLTGEDYSFDKQSGPYAVEYNSINNYKKVLLMVMGTAAKLVMSGKLDLKEEQEVIMNLSNIIIDIYTGESLLMNVEKKQKLNTTIEKEVLDAILRTYLHDANFNILKNATDAVMAFIREDKLDNFLTPIHQFCNYPLQNTKKLRRIIAKAAIEKKSYLFAKYS